MSIKRKRVQAGTPQGGEFAAQGRSESSVELRSAAELAGSPVPVVEFMHLTHVGNLDPVSKKERSYEGQGLSVSRHPNAWSRIARLGGDIWVLNGAPPKLLSYHELSAEQVEDITAFGVDRGYIVMEDRVEGSWYDEESEDTMTSIFMTFEEAEYELEEQDGVTLTQVSTPIATEHFPDSTVKAGDSGVEQILATVWVNEVATELDGIWWEDRFDPYALSAPRGVIASRAIEGVISRLSPAPIGHMDPEYDD